MSFWKFTWIPYSVKNAVDGLAAAPNMVFAQFCLQEPGSNKAKQDQDPSEETIAV